MPNHDEITEYRPCVGVMLLNEQGRVWIGRRYDKANEEGEGYWWQMPQGGIDKGEDAAAAALRELAEETAITSAHVIAEIAPLVQLRPPRTPDRQVLEGQVPRPDAEMVRAALHRRRQRGEPPPAGALPGIRPVALGAAWARCWT